MALYAGMGVGDVTRRETAADVIRELVGELREPRDRRDPR
jgi:hypothetical protein